MIKGDKHRVFVDINVLRKSGDVVQVLNKAVMHPLDLAPAGSFIHLQTVTNGYTEDFDTYIVNRTVEPRPKPGLVTYYAVEVDVAE